MAPIDPMIQIRKTSIVDANVLSREYLGAVSHVLAIQKLELRMSTHRNIGASSNAIWPAKAGLAGIDFYRVLRRNAVTSNVRVQRTWTAAQALTSPSTSVLEVGACVVMGGLMAGIAQLPEANAFPPMVSNTDQFGTMPTSSDLEPSDPTPETSQGKIKAVDCLLDAVKMIYNNAEDVDDDEDPIKVPRPLAQPASALFDLTPATSATGQKVVRKVIAVQIPVHKYSKVVKDHTCNDAQPEAERPTSQQSVPRIGFLAFADQNGLQRSPGAVKKGKDEDEWTQFVPQ
ncbi:hypothetical protein Tdes44962_MAKER04727 [Teratosphaeria destructans]|uniref:Uncharacterized protein n=1 Tax=Teratosphaeria destructans TaxID=418781 RepID=A0A9W7VZH9_9PEZI|nr:hypothetical protein Tdes44962_MAKER04727 [Teratosphaeria destructans]